MSDNAPRSDRRAGDPTTTPRRGGWIGCLMCAVGAILLLSFAALYFASRKWSAEIAHWVIRKKSEVAMRALFLFNPSAKESEGGMILWQAVLVDDGFAFAQKVLDAGVDPNKHGWSMSAFSLAMGDAKPGGDTSVLRWLIDRGANPALPDTGEMTPLHFLARRHNIHGQPLSYFLEVADLVAEHGADPNARDLDGHTPLRDALMEDGSSSLPPAERWIFIEKLLDLGADPALLDAPAHRALLKSALEQGEEEQFAQLVALGPRWGAGEGFVEYKLAGSALAANTARPLGALMGHGLDPNATLDGAPLLAHAAATGVPEIVAALLAAGADPTLRDGFDRTPLDLAKSRGHAEIVALLEAALRKKEEAARQAQAQAHRLIESLLLDPARTYAETLRLEGFDLNQTVTMSPADGTKPDFEWSILGAAAMLDDPSAIDWLVDAGADPNWPAPMNGSRPLHVAVEMWHVETLAEEGRPFTGAAMRRLVERGADIDAVDAAGHSPLKRALDEGIGRPPVRSTKMIYVPPHRREEIAAWKASRYPVIATLLELGADPSSLDERARGELLWRVAQAGDVATFRRLIKTGLRDEAAFDRIVAEAPFPVVNVLPEEGLVPSYEAVRRGETHSLPPLQSSGRNGGAPGSELLAPANSDAHFATHGSPLPDPSAPASIPSP